MWCAAIISVSFQKHAYLEHTANLFLGGNITSMFPPGDSNPACYDMYNFAFTCKTCARLEYYQRHSLYLAGTLEWLQNQQAITHIFSQSPHLCAKMVFGYCSNHLLFQKLSLGMRQRTCWTLEEEVTKKSNSFSPLKEQKFLGGRSLKGVRKKDSLGSCQNVQQSQSKRLLSSFSKKMCNIQFAAWKTVAQLNAG